MEPSMSTLIHTGDDLLHFIQRQCDSKASRAILYSQQGFDHRTLVKRTMEKEIEQRTLLLCFLTCGLAICCCGCCSCCNRKEENLTEAVYCEEIKATYPNESYEVAYEFSS